ncbi:hypothetical protein [Insolitispirillum peregrinum]|uniref:hypothetical protein n=1 Tax=Insolitispirillum peregrinum TaxID=80876 RepID=UPI00360F95A7
MKTAVEAPAIKAHWWAKTLAGVICGFALALALATLFHQLTPGGPGKLMLLMWLISPLWLTMASLVYLFRDGWRAWGWLGGASVLAYGAVFVSKLGS